MNVLEHSGHDLTEDEVLMLVLMMVGVCMRKNVERIPSEIHMSDTFVKHGEKL